MSDIFDNDILCKNCHLKMEKGVMRNNGFELRFVECDNCSEKIMHPGDLQEYKQFDDLKQKHFRVKLRLVGNSYAVSIPKEIVDFIKEQDDIVNNMVNLCFEEMNRISLMFDDVRMSKIQKGIFDHSQNSGNSEVENKLNDKEDED